MMKCQYYTFSAAKYNIRHQRYHWKFIRYRTENYNLGLSTNFFLSFFSCKSISLIRPRRTGSWLVELGWLLTGQSFTSIISAQSALNWNPTKRMWSLVNLPPYWSCWLLIGWAKDSDWLNSEKLRKAVLCNSKFQIVPCSQSKRQSVQMAVHPGCACTLVYLQNNVAKSLPCAIVHYYVVKLC